MAEIKMVGPAQRMFTVACEMADSAWKKIVIASISYTFK